MLVNFKDLKMIIISGSSNKELAKKIANNLHERPTPRRIRQI